jgi:phage/plasmid-associated DNA primase
MRNPDKATWNRIRVIPFESTFIDPGLPCPEEYEEQLRQKKFPQDRRLHDKIPCMLPAFAWYLLHHRRTEVPEPPPPKVLEATRKYEVSNDKIKLFIEEMLESAPTETIAMGTVWTTFREWQKENFPAHTQDRPSIKNYFTKTWGALDKNQCWKGWRLKRCSVADDDAISGGVPGM